MTTNCKTCDGKKIIRTDNRSTDRPERGFQNCEACYGTGIDLNRISELLAELGLLEKIPTDATPKGLEIIDRLLESKRDVQGAVAQQIEDLESDLRTAQAALEHVERQCDAIVAARIKFKERLGQTAVPGQISL